MTSVLLALALCLPAQAEELTPDQIEAYLLSCANGEHPEIRDMVDKRVRLASGRLGKPSNKKEAAELKDRIQDIDRDIEKAVKKKPFPEPRLHMPVVFGAVGGFSPKTGVFRKRVADGVIEVDIRSDIVYYEKMVANQPKQAERRPPGTVLLRVGSENFVDKQEVKLAPLYECKEVLEIANKQGVVTSARGVLTPADETPYKAWLEANKKEAWERIEKLREERPKK